MKEVRRLWNAGLEKEEMVDHLLKRNKDLNPSDIRAAYDHIESQVGCRSLTVHELHGGRPLNRLSIQRLLNSKPVVDTSKWSESYKRWKGVSGHGLLLKEILKNP